MFVCVCVCACVTDNNVEATSGMFILHRGKAKAIDFASGMRF